jgi:GWxTD domain-containing protein
LRASAVVATLIMMLGPVLDTTAGGAAAAPGGASRAEGLYHHALRELELGGFDARRLALRELEQATLLAPGNPLYELTLARAYYLCGFLSSARVRFERVVRMAPDDADGRFGLGLVWRRDWLKYLDRASLARAVDQFTAVTRVNRERADAWLALVPLLIEQDRLPAATAAAATAFEADPARPEALLAIGATAWRSGNVTRADAAFTRAIPRLERNVRAVFDDISPVATSADTTTLHHLPVSEQAEFVRRFWRANDPDLATPENEARLEYWSRVTQAYFLFYNPRRKEWDERGEVYVRYGAPKTANYNPVDQRLSVSFGTGPNFPANVLVWDYPELGMSVTMQDRMLSEYYLLPMSLSREMDPVPDPDSLARRTDSMPLAGGRGVFHRLPPGVTPLALEAAVARFEAGGAARLLAQLETPGGPADTLTAEWVVLDSTREEVARASRELSPSACDAGTRRVAEFAAELPPGRYLVGLSVRNGSHGRGVYRREVTLTAPREALALSDVVIGCGAPDLTPSAPGEPPAIRLQSNPGGRVSGLAPLSAYFEIYHLQPAASGMSRFEYVYTVRSTEKDPRIWLQRMFSPRAQPPPISASREEDTSGSLRRQFVTVPVQSLPAGRYRLEIKVRDLVAGEEAVSSADFVRVTGESARN